MIPSYLAFNTERANIPQPTKNATPPKTVMTDDNGGYKLDHLKDTSGAMLVAIAVIDPATNGMHDYILSGSGANMVTGDYSRGASGFWIEKGRRTYPVSEVTIAGHLLDIFRTALDRLGPGRALVVGDRADADLAGALATGLDGALVGGERSDDAVACADTLVE